MKKFSLAEGNVVEYDSSTGKIDELDAFTKIVLNRTKNEKTKEFDETLISINIICNSETILINDATDEEQQTARRIIQDYIKDQTSSMPYIIYTIDDIEAFCCECNIQEDGTAIWRVLRAKDVSRADVKYFKKVLTDLGIYKLNKKSRL